MIEPPVSLGPRATILLGLIAGHGTQTTDEIYDLINRADRSESFTEIRRDLPAEAAAPFFAVAELAREGVSAVRLLLERLEGLSLVSRVTVEGEDLWAKR